MKDSSFGHLLLVTALACIILAMTGLAHGECLSQKTLKHKKGTLKIRMTTAVGGVTLEPGEYEVKQVKSASGPIVRFTRVTYNPYAYEGLSPYDWETVAEIKVSLQALCSKAARTELLLASNTGTPIGLEIRGSGFEYLF
jgi:hypothetical protein